MPDQPSGSAAQTPDRGGETQAGKNTTPYRAERVGGQPGNAAPEPATTTATPASGGLASRSGLSAAQAKTLQVGDPVMCWPGERRGTGYLMFLAYEGVHDIGGTKCIYVRPMGGHSRGMALTHCEVPCR